MTSQRIVHGDCLDVFANEKNVPAIVADPPGLVGYSGFMGRKWDTAHESFGTFVPMLPPRDKRHARELEMDRDFTMYWAVRYAMAYDIADQHATMILWTLPRTAHLTANAVRAAGWDIRDNLVHLFGTGWAKTGNALAPGQEGWLLATKGKPDLDIDACRVPRGGAIEDRMPGGQRRKQRNMNGAHDDCELVDPPLPDIRGSLPKNALLSHCEECVRVGVKKAKATSIHGEATAVRGNSTHGQAGGHLTPGRTQRVSGFANEDGTESVPAWHCLAGCVCGARSKWDPEKPLPTCHCGEVWRWLCAVAEVNAQSGDRASGGTRDVGTGGSGMFKKNGRMEPRESFTDQGGASRFFNTFSPLPMSLYTAKCSSSERHAGCESLYWRANKKNPFGFDLVTKEEWEILQPRKLSPSQQHERNALRGSTGQDQRAQGNVHPTVKSYHLMHWLHGLTGAKKIVDLCAGSGTGMLTAALDGIEWIGAEMCPEAVIIAQARHAFWSVLSPEAIELMKKDSATKAIQKQNKIARLENK